MQAIKDKKSLLETIRAARHAGIPERDIASAGYQSGTLSGFRPRDDQRFGPQGGVE
jgi:hypothetical protein